MSHATPPSPQPEATNSSLTQSKGYLPTFVNSANYRLPPPSEQGGDDPARVMAKYFDIFIRHQLPIIATTVACGAAMLIYAMNAPRIYTANAIVQVTTYVPLLPGKSSSEDVFRQQSAEEEYFATQLELLRSLPLADAVLKQGDIKESLFAATKVTPSLMSRLLASIGMGKSEPPKLSPGVSPYVAPLDQLHGYLRVVSAEPVKRTSLIQISVATQDPILSAKIANAHSQAYSELLRSQRQVTTDSTLLFLQQREREFAEKIADVERKLTRYAEAHAIVSLENDQNITLKELEEVSRQLTDIRARRMEAENRFKEARNAKGGASTFLDDPAMGTLREELSKLEGERATLLRKYTPEYPAVVQIEAQLAQLRGGLKRQRGEALRALGTSYDSYIATETQLSQQLDKLKAQAFELSKVLVDYRVMERELLSLRDLNQEVSRQIKEAQLRSGSLPSNVSIVEPAAPPLLPSAPRRKLLVIMGLVLGLVIGVLTALMREIFNKTLQDPEDLEDKLNLPLLGMIPRMAALNNEQADYQIKELTVLGKISKFTRSLKSSLTRRKAAATSGIVTSTGEEALLLPLLPSQKASHQSESFRNIRAAIRLSAADSHPRIMLVTSAEAGSGKTTITSNLGIAFAEYSARTLVIDADLRRPRLSHFVQIPPKMPGLVDVLAKGRAIDHTILKSHIPNLWVLPAGSFTPNPGELLGSQKMQTLLRLLSSRFDYILLDCAPVLPVADALLLSRIVEGVLFVIRSDKTNHNSAARALAKLAAARAPILGGILNGVQYTRPEYQYTMGDSSSFYQADDVAENVDSAA